MRFKNKCAKKKIAVIFGGRGIEHGISELSANFVLKFIDREKFDPLPILIEKTGEMLLLKSKGRVSVSFVQRGGEGGIIAPRRFIKIDAAFPVLHGDFGEDGRIQGLIETLGIPLVGCNTVTGAVAADKCFSKAVARSVGIPTLDWISSAGKTKDEFEEECEGALGFPVFIKPARLGSSFGAGIAQNREELSERVRLAFELGGGLVIAEKYLKSPRELECAFLELSGKKHVSHPGQISQSSGFYGFLEKYGENSKAKIRTHAKITESEAAAIKSYAITLAQALGVCGISRIDFFLHDGKIYFNEINTLPGMTDISLYPKMVKEMGFSEKEFINGLLEEAVGDGL